MRGYEDSISKAGGTIAAVGLGDMRYAQAFREETLIEFPLLVDERREAYRALGLAEASIFHLLKRFNTRARAIARQAGFRQHRLGRNVFQLGGSFVFGPGDSILFRHFSRTFGDNAPPGELLKAVRSSGA